jgi:uncharacterized protein (DUF2249 family)
MLKFAWQLPPKPGLDAPNRRQSQPGRVATPGNTKGSGMETVHVVDARSLEPPEPMERVMEALSSMKPGEKVQLLLYREPFPLYGILQRNHYAHRAELRDDGTFEILIWEETGGIS